MHHLCCGWQTASCGSCSTSPAACLWPCRTWRNGRRLYSIRQRTWLSWSLLACTHISLHYGGRVKRKVSDSCMLLAFLIVKIQWGISLYIFLLSSVVLDLTHLRDICVQEERVRYLGKGYLLMLRLATGFSYPLTQSATLGGRRYIQYHSEKATVIK